MPETPGQKIQRQIAAIREQGGDDADIESFLSSHSEVRQEDEKPHLSIPAAAKDGSHLTKGLDSMQYMGSLAAGLATTAPQALPGMERVQAGVRSVVRGQSYDEALGDMRENTDHIPAAVKMMTQTPAMMAMGKLPVSPATAGALFSGASQALSADRMGVPERAMRTVGAGVVGGVAGKVLDVGSTFVRAKGEGSLVPLKLRSRKSPGEMTADVLRRTEAADAKNYGAAAAEGNAAPPQIPAIRHILENPHVKPYAHLIRQSAEFAEANDATVLTETYKLLSNQQKGLRQRLSENGFDAGMALENRNIELAKRQMLKVSDRVMPGFRKAVTEHAKLEGEQAAIATGADASRRVIGVAPSGKRLATQSSEAFAKKIRDMRPEERRQAVAAFLGQLKDRIGFQPNAVSIGGLLTSIKRPAQASKFLRSVGDEGQAKIDGLIRTVINGAANGGR